MSTLQQLDEQSTRLYRIRRTVMQMLRDREYVVADVELSLSKDQFREKFGDEPKREDLVLRKTKRSNPNEQVDFPGFVQYLAWIKFRDFVISVESEYIFSTQLLSFNVHGKGCTEVDSG